MNMIFVLLLSALFLFSPADTRCEKIDHLKILAEVELGDFIKDNKPAVLGAGGEVSFQTALTF